MNTQLHISCVLTGTFEFFPDCWEQFFFLGSTVQNITTQTRYALFRVFFVTKQ